MGNYMTLKPPNLGKNLNVDISMPCGLSVPAEPQNKSSSLRFRRNAMWTMFATWALLFLCPAGLSLLRNLRHLQGYLTRIGCDFYSQRSYRSRGT